MNDDEAQKPTPPTPQQLGRTRDGIALMEFLIAGDIEAVVPLMDSLRHEPDALPLVFKSMAGVIEHALNAPEGTDPATFFAAIRQMMDGGQG